MEKLHSFKGRLSCILLRIIAKTSIGELAAADHCHSAVTELKALDKAFTTLREQQPDSPMPNWDALRGAMPDWDTLCCLYGKSKTQKE